eukprot:5156100-Ditylum_brightwellii.AAC.1
MPSSHGEEKPTGCTHSLQSLPLLDRVIQEELIPALLNVDVVDDTILPLFSLPVKYAGIRALTPTHEHPLNCATSVSSTVYLKGAIKHEYPLNTVDHD